MATFIGARCSDGTLTLHFSDGVRVEKSDCNPTLRDVKALSSLIGCNLSADEIMKEISE